MLFLITSLVPTAVDSTSLIVPVGAALRQTTGGGDVASIIQMYIWTIYFMQGFLPHPNSRDLKYRIVLAKLHDTTFAKVVKNQFIDV